MEAFLAILIALTMILRFLGRDRLAAGFFGVAIVLLALVLRFHASDVLNLNF